MEEGLKFGRLPFLGLALAAMTGITIAEYHPMPLAMGAILVGAAAILWLATRKTLGLLLLVTTAFVLLHSLQFQNNAGRLLAAALGDRRILLEGEGTISSIPVERPVGSRGRIESEFALNVVHANLPGLPSGLRLMISWPGHAPEYGTRIHFIGTVTNEPPPRNPGEFDYADWLARQQIFSSLKIRYPADGVIIGHGSSWSPMLWASRSRAWMEARMTLDLENDPDIAGVIKAMVLGTTSENLDDLKRQMQQTGTLHLFAVSGLQVTILAAMALFALQTIRIPRRLAMWLTIPLILFYALITGWGASSVRAAIMSALFLGSVLADRPVLTLNTLAASAFLILLGDPNQLFNTGFQLSYSVVVAILLLANPISRFLQKPGEPDPFIPRKLLTRFQKTRWRFTRWLAGTLGLTLAAWIGSMPLTAWYFNLLSPVALLANLVIIPWSFVILLLGVISVLTSIVGNWLTILFNNANWFAVQVLLWMVHTFASIPSGYLHVGGRWLQFSHEYRVTVLDLGAGGSTVIETPRGCWLIDLGSEMTYQRNVRSFLEKRGINHLDGILLTHGDGQHVGGIVSALRDFPGTPVYLPKIDADSVVFRRLSLHAAGLRSGDYLTIGPEATLQILWPDQAASSFSRADDKALVIALQIYGKRLLLTSDSGFATESALMGQSGLTSDLLIMGRNQDDITGTPDFLDSVAPRAIICSATNFPASEQVPPEWGAWCDSHEIPLFRQDQTGAVEIHIRPDACEITGFLNGEKLKFGSSH